MGENRVTGKRVLTVLGVLAAAGMAALLVVPSLVFPPNLAGSPGLRDAVRDLSGALPVFPGAEGFGTDTPAGRGGAVLRVTSLESAGPGTLRAALETPGPRVVVFEAGGGIRLSEPLTIPHPFVTVAGEPAPPPGITLTGAGLVIATHDALVRHLRIRVGDRMPGPPGDARDGLSVYPGGDGQAFNVVVDHCSVGWAVDEGASHWGAGVRDVTFSGCIFSENLSHSIHPEGEHSKGLLLGDHGRRIAVAGCLFAHNDERNPYVKGDVSALVVNNLVYNPRRNAMHVGDYNSSGPSLTAFMGNVLKPGPDTRRGVPLVTVHVHTQRTAVVGMFDNLCPGRAEWGEWAWSTRRVNLARLEDSPVRVSPLTVRPAATVADWVLAHAGARPADRDAVDTRVVDEVRTGAGRIIDSQEQVGGMPQDAATRRPLELPPAPGADDDRDGYTNLEEWLHAQAGEVEGAE